MHAALARRGKPRWGEKTPLNVSHLDWILPRFPDARFVHVIRDGRDAVCSMRTHGTRRLVEGRWVKTPTRSGQSRTARALAAPGGARGSVTGAIPGTGSCATKTGALTG